jgi:hypothetical protein
MHVIVAGLNYSQITALAEVFERNTGANPRSLSAQEIWTFSDQI